MYGDNVAAVPVSYVVNCYGTRFTERSVTVNTMTATIDLPAVDSDVKFRVAAQTVFGRAVFSNTLKDKISELTTYIQCMYMHMHVLLTWIHTYVAFITGIYICNWPRIITFREI